MLREKHSQRVLKYFGDNGRHSYATVVVFVTQITLVIFYDWHYGAVTKLLRHKAMSKHRVDDGLKSLEKRERSVEEMLCKDQGVRGEGGEN